MAAGEMRASFRSTNPWLSDVRWRIRRWTRRLPGKELVCAEVDGHLRDH